MTKEIITPYQSLLNFNSEVDTALVHLDKACEHFEHAVLPSDYEDLEKVNPDKDKLVTDIKSYVLLTGFIMDHPLIQVLKDIRDTSQVESHSTALTAIKHSFKIGQNYLHYKGTTYTIVAIGKDANNPVIEVITYKDDKDNYWCLPSYEFARKVTVNNVEQYRFSLLGRGFSQPHQI